MHPNESDVQSDLVDVLADYYEMIDGVITVIDRYREENRGNYQVGRRLSLAITDLESAQDKMRRVIATLQSPEG